MAPLDKQILEQYIDACELIKDTKEEIKKLRKRRTQIQQDSVKGSSHEFPYTLQTYHLEGLGYAVVKDPDELERMEELLAKRIQNAEQIRRQVEVWLNTISPRMQRIIRYKIFEEMTWGQVAVRMGRKATADSVRMEFERFMAA
ncbi:RNA polymerase subunit sigma-70 [Clostridium sp. AM29-11AC]|uniref:RNA polymerase subunit sigma-70 n=1 Tax=Clostridium sp. AM29-11AC TaxID=2293028 RepID=UPI00325AB033